MKKGQRPSKHIRRIMTRMGRKLKLINPQIPKKVRRKKSYSMGYFENPEERDVIMGKINEARGRALGTPIGSKEWEKVQGMFEVLGEMKLLKPEKAAADPDMLEPNEDDIIMTKHRYGRPEKREL